MDQPKRKLFTGKHFEPFSGSFCNARWPALWGLGHFVPSACPRATNQYIWYEIKYLDSALYSGMEDARPGLVERMRTRSILLGLVAALAAAVAPLGATTLIQLSLNDLITLSSGIVRAKVTGVRTDYRGADIYTYYQLQVSEDWRASGLTPTAPQQIEVAVPGGVARGVRQTVAGSPSMVVGQEYVVFMWTSRSGLTQVIGLSQGLFLVQADANGNPVLVRPASGETVVDKNGNPVTDQALSISLAALRAQTRSTLGGAQ